LLLLKYLKIYGSVLNKSKTTHLIVIGDAAPYGVYLPVEKWLGQLALAAGFKRFF